MQTNGIAPEGNVIKLRISSCRIPDLCGQKNRNADLRMIIKLNNIIANKNILRSTSWRRQETSLIIRAGSNSGGLSSRRGDVHLKRFVVLMTIKSKHIIVSKTSYGARHVDDRRHLLKSKLQRILEISPNFGMMA
jgi:hypothetical protein